ncbi:hypothetical protein H6F90_21615 [Trichocoleus sp. FACHB-591]|uniref:hypothetical protein n=1 Tax=Trichocoleus sp. FACHB-591 TaxID=2692872 RepID=UPI0016825DC5|nr:hypothetical protein [Trichocoleus sp. FACHB-591]MBD2097698.1 hypothetical protein [Trichocoleus sp. FACHB-591]
MALALFLLVLLWLLASYVGLRRSLYWWYQRQTAQMSGEAECIREDLLQKLFAMRRGLELALMEKQAHPKEVQHWLTQLETIQHSLEAVTHRLAPSYLDDSLPLAVQFVLKEWQKAHPTLPLEMALSTDWVAEPLEQRRMVLATLTAWLQITAAHLRAEGRLRICLSQKAHSGEMLIQLTAPNRFDLPSGVAISELTKLQQAFQVLANGNCYCQKSGSTVTWCYRWRSL